MIGAFLTRGLVMIFAYVYPAYECYKTVEMNKPDIEQLRFWCQYWILVAVLTMCERIGDAFISWVPMYSEAKLVFFIYLWYPKTKGTTYVYDSFFRPYVAEHESEIDRTLLELKTRAGDMAVICWQKAASYGQTRIHEILRFIAAQSAPAPHPSQQPQQGGRASQTAAAPNRQTSNGPNRRPAASPKRQSSTASQPEAEEPPSPASSRASSQQQEVEVEVVPPKGPQTAPVAAASVSEGGSDASNVKVQSTSTEAEAKEIEAVPPPTDENTNPPLKETLMEGTIRVTRASLRRTRAAANRQ